MVGRRLRRHRNKKLYLLVLTVQFLGVWEFSKQLSVCHAFLSSTTTTIALKLLHHSINTPTREQEDTPQRTRFTNDLKTLHHLSRKISKALYHKSNDDQENDYDEGTDHSHDVDYNRRDFLARHSWAAASLGVATSTGFTAENVYASSSPPTTTIMQRKESMGNKRQQQQNQQNYQEPFSSSRQYKAITLTSGMKVVLVSDRTVSQSSAAMTIRGAGQFSDPPNLNGLAHLMEHMTLSSGTGTTSSALSLVNSRRKSKGGDFEEWLNEDQADGFSNGFTAYEKVCFHFQCNSDAFTEAIERFARLFQQDVVERACRGNTVASSAALKREIRRINSELDRNDLFTRELYLTKSLINPSHPYARMTMGSLDTLERIPTEMDMDVGGALFEFFQRYYQSRKAVLVLISPLSLVSLESLAAPFSTTMSKRPPFAQDEMQRVFPPFLPPSGRFNGETKTSLGDGSSNNVYCLFRNSGNDIGGDTEKLSFQWSLDREYTSLRNEVSTGNVVTATQIGFVLAEILGRRGPGSLYDLLKRRKWIPDGTQGVPRISFPVDVSGFQILRLELSLTLKGFGERAGVITAVYDAISSIPSGLSRELVAQTCSVAQLYGHLLAPRPPDAIELSFDGQIYGVDGPKGVASPTWRLMPLPEDSDGVRSVQQAALEVVQKIRDPAKAITIVTSSQRAIQYVQAQNSVTVSPFPLFSPASWRISPVTGARYYTDFRRANKVTDWLVAKLLTRSEIEPPVINPLIPPYIRPPRIVAMTQEEIQSRDSRQQQNMQQFASLSSSGEFIADPTKTAIARDYWELLKVYPNNSPLFSTLKLPRIAPETSPRCVFICQFLSSRPPRASSKMAANAEVWKLSLEYALSDLAELGAPAGLSYEISFNKYGLRIAFLGLSQNIASYARRISRRIIYHQYKLLDGPEKLPDPVLEASRRNVNRFRMSSQRRAVLLNVLKDVTAKDAALEGISFFDSCSGAVCIAQGDILPSEALELLADLKVIFKQVIGNNIIPTPAIPEPKDFLYGASWIPRSASACTIPGSNLISNACGRVPR
eukprot:CAMPEP_0113491300 /NCGR_PEP_ID=MMETSP0014_2-20120614/27486_1 /TAXON_ID=2857 /ORGANISM="Nitzschia sp." /LENGTH=1047 /DNA_ID=CAMNT_0000385089 /DNA_START=151 /DNA_END=3294 /DNA_ORIENTATION=- /assembly_acc=CAM_ASM_000159